MKRLIILSIPAYRCQQPSLSQHHRGLLNIFGITTSDGARTLGLSNKIGTLEPGKKANIIAVPLPKKNTNDLYSDLLRETKSCIMTMVNGKILYRE